MYHYLPWLDGQEYRDCAAGVDELVAIDLQFENRGTIAISWFQFDTLEAIGILDGESYVGVGGEVLDGSQREAWRKHIGETITEVGVSWHDSGEGAPESLWALRLGFATGSVVIALGELAPELKYIHDSIVVMFDESMARSWRLPHVELSAWGETLR